MGTRIHRGMAARPRLASAVLVLAVWGLSTATAHAQNPYTWNNGTTTSFTGDWSVAGNWRNAGNSPGVPPSSATTQLAFGGTGDYTSSNDTGTFVLNRLTSTNSGLVLLDGSAAAVRWGQPPVVPDGRQHRVQHLEQHPPSDRHHVPGDQRRLPEHRGRGGGPGRFEPEQPHAGRGGQLDDHPGPGGRDQSHRGRRRERVRHGHGGQRHRRPGDPLRQRPSRRRGEPPVWRLLVGSNQALGLARSRSTDPGRRAWATCSSRTSSSRTRSSWARTFPSAPRPGACGSTARPSVGRTSTWGQRRGR